MKFFLSINVFTYTSPISKKDFRQFATKHIDRIKLKPSKTNKKAKDCNFKSM